ncbi:MAG: hypothetical protein NVSMB1_19180 [Polyangiales bacterium]
MTASGASGLAPSAPASRGDSDGPAQLADITDMAQSTTFSLKNFRNRPLPPRTALLLRPLASLVGVYRAVQCLAMLTEPWQWFRLSTVMRTACSPLVAVALAASASALIVVVSPLVTVAAATHSNVEVHWAAPIECPSEASVRGACDRLLAGSSSRKAVVANANVTVESGPAYRLTLVTRSGETTGERTVEAASCQTVADAAALIVAMTIDPSAPAISAVASSSASSPAPATSSISPAASADPLAKGANGSVSSPSSSTGSVAPASSTAPPSSESLSSKGTNVTNVTNVKERAAPAVPAVSKRAVPAGSGSSTGDARPTYAFGAAAAFDAFALPHPAFGVRGDASFTRGSFRAEAFVTFFPSSRATLPDRDAGGNFSLLAVGAASCLKVATLALDWSACGGAEVGRMSASGFGVPVLMNGAGTWVAASGGALGVLGNDEVAFYFQLDAVVPFLRQDFVIEGVSAVHTTKAVTARVIVGGEMRFR